jgi:RND superfamily putative drug exporter
MAGESVGGWTESLSSYVVRNARAVVLAWIAIVAVLNIAIPQIETVVQNDSTSFVPLDAPAVVGLQRMDDEFGNGKSSSFVQVVAYREGGLTAADKQYMRDLVPRLRADKKNVTFVQNLEKKDVRKALTSDDREVMYLPVGIPGATGAPAANAQIDSVRHDIQAGKPEGLTTEVTGTSATIRDMVHEIESSLGKVTMVVLGIIALIVLILYRSLAVTALILGMIGLALGLARAVTSFFGMHVFGISTFTGSVMTVVVLGAATDYAVFLISRYHEYRRADMPVRQAAAQAGTRISGIIIGSALTVAIANAAMLMAEVAFFRTTGPAVAVSVVATLALAITLIPAVLVLAGERGLMEPRPARGDAFWGRLAGLVVTRPARVLLAGLIPLAALASFYPAMAVSYDERGGQPDDTESNRGFTILDAHFPVNEVLPHYAVIFSEHDVRSAENLAAIERASDEVARLDGIRDVRSITRPRGDRIEEASVGYQAGEVGEELDEAADEIGDGSKDAQKLADGAEELDDGAGELNDGTERMADGTDRAVDGAERLLKGAERLTDGLKRMASGAHAAQGGSAQLQVGADQLADGLETGYEQAKVAVDGLGMAYDALATKSLTCNVDPACRAARDGIRQIYEAQRDQMLPGLKQAAEAARQIANGSGDLRDGLAQLSTALERARKGAARVENGQELMASKLGELADGADELHDGTSQLEDGTGKISDGTQEAADSVEELEEGLTEAADFLLELGEISRNPEVSGFYLPAEAFEDDRLVTAVSLYLSSDANTARLFVLDEADANSREAAIRTEEIKAAVERGLAGTELEGSRVELTGNPTFNANLHDLSQADFWTVAIIALIAVLIILIVMLRSVLAPIFLLLSVVLSYAAAMGLGVIVWQMGLGKPLDWSTPPMAFVMLVAVGADYNLLLMKRIQEEAADGSRAGIGRAVALTGGVITAAGLIFAFSMFAMMAGSTLSLAQMGFTVGMGLLLDTFVVRTLIVPSAAAILGPAMWWPRKVEYWTVPRSSEFVMEDAR